MSTIPLLVPSVPEADEILPWLRRIDQARWYTNFGPLVQEFEQRLLALFQPRTGSLGLTTVNNCTTGIELALQALELPRGARVLVPSLTFVATGTAALRAGLTPVISDVGMGNWLLTPEIASAALTTTSIDAVMPVATFGCPQPVSEWDEFSERTGLPVVIDAAGAMGNQAAGRKAVVVFSLHATKALGVGEGGFVVAERGLVQQVRRLSNFGLDADTGLLERAGCNGKMSEYHAAVGLAALAAWEDTSRRRRELMRRYLCALRESHLPITFQEKPETGVYSLLPVALPEGTSAAETANRLAQQGIETRRWYHPALHNHPALRHAEKCGTLPITESLARRILGLPFHLHLTDGQIQRVCKALATALE